MSALTQQRPVPTHAAPPAQSQSSQPSEVVTPTQPCTQPQRHRWTVDEYMRLADTGLFTGRRTELIDGEVLDVAPQNNPHIAGISNTNELLVLAFHRKYWLTVQSTVRLPSGDAPEPDFAIKRWTPERG